MEAISRAMRKRRALSTVSILGALLLAVALSPITQVDRLALTNFNPLELRSRTLWLALIAFGAFFAVLKMIPITAGFCLRRGLFGRDINKNGTTPVPEALGIITGTVFLVATALAQPLFSQGGSLLGQV